MRIASLCLLGILFCAIAGCSGGDNTQVGIDRSKEFKKGNEEALKKNPPPPGDGPSN